MLEEDLKTLRSQIDKIDEDLLKLIVKRSSIVDKIGISKKKFSCYRYWPRCISLLYESSYYNGRRSIRGSIIG